MRLRAAETAALAELREWLERRFGARLRTAALFGSRARGAGDEDSDLDVCVTVDGLSFAEGREISRFCGDLLTRHDVLVAPFAVSRERFDELLGRERTIALEIAGSAVPL